MRVYRCEQCNEEYFDFEGVVVCGKCGNVLSTGERNSKIKLELFYLFLSLFLFSCPLQAQEVTIDYKMKYETLKLSVMNYLNDMSQNRQKLEKLSENLEQNSSEAIESLSQSNKLIEDYKIQSIKFSKQIQELQNSKDKLELDLVILENRLEDMEKLKKDSENLSSQIEEKYKEEIRNQKTKTVTYSLGSFVVGLVIGLVL